jgi:glycosyltransferase involved in cell wall biosynthesis
LFRINIILPFPVTKPVGGAKIMYEYANYFSARGHQVTVLHSLRRPFKKMKSPIWWKRFVFFCQRAERPRWFLLDANVNSYIVDEITDAFVPDGDIVFSTWWQMTHAIASLSPAKGVPVNLIQDYEVWAGQEENLLASYRLPVHHAAIATWLQNLAEREAGRAVKLLPNAIDLEKFRLISSIDQRASHSVIALYSEEERKGTAYAIAAAEELKKVYPDLQWTFFGVYPRPAHLPSWIQYHRRPVNLPELYNAHAIFVSASNGEGWALPPAEAMACGCTVVCTDIGGHADYAMQEKTALLFMPKDTEGMVQQLSRLFTNDQLRIELAAKGREFLTQQFNWKHSVDTALEWFLMLQKNNFEASNNSSK